MTRGILIAGNESALIRAVETEAAKRAEHFAAALIPNRLSGQLTGAPANRSGQDPLEKARLPLDWNPGSPISVRALALAAQNRLLRIDEAVLVCAPPPLRCAAADLPLADIDILVNDHIKSWFYLVRELAAYFRRRQGGTLALVYQEAGAGGGRDETADLPGPSALASFKAFTHSLLTASFSEPYHVMGFSAPCAGDEAGFAAFIMKHLDEGNERSSGRLFKYGKLNFFK
jgi:hypothetical protein